MTLLENRYFDLIFYKMEGNGNDFVVIDNTENMIEEPLKSKLSKVFCDRRFGVGADGVMMVEMSERADYRMRLFNADGSEAEMCGNGVRCFALFCRRVKGYSGDILIVETKTGMIRVWFEGELIGLNIGRVVEMGNPLKDCDGMLVDVGVPHYVVPVEKVDVVDVGGWGRELRYRKEFPEGANVDFVEYVDSNTIKVRTYERGVENETLSCGTGAVASAYVSYVYGRCEFPVTIINPGGNLKVGVKYTTDGVQELSLMGGARLVFKGVWVDE